MNAQLLGRITYFHTLFIEPNIPAGWTTRPEPCCEHTSSGALGPWTVLQEIASSLGHRDCRCCPACGVLLYGRALAACWIDVELTAYDRPLVPERTREQWADTAGLQLSSAFTEQGAGLVAPVEEVPVCDLPLTGELLALWTDPAGHTPVVNWLNHCTDLWDIARVLREQEKNVTPIQLAETLAIGSVEEFLTSAEITTLAEIMDVLLVEGVSEFDEQRASSIHEIPGHTPGQAMAVYEPNGRVEIPKLPAGAELILQGAFDRARPALSRTLPSVTSCRPWTYVEYGPEQHITTHLDGIAPDPLTWPRQIAGISIVLADADTGGNFYIETTSADQLWERAHTGDGYGPGMHLARDGADQSADWFRQMPRTRWRAYPAPGTALLYGSQLAHGTEPVTGGRARKFISWLTAENK